MEKRLSLEEACRLIREDLGIDRSRVRPCFDEYGTRVCCLVHESWIQKCVAGPISEWVSPISPWSSYEHQLLLQPSHPGPAAPWLRITIQIVKKPSRKTKPVMESLSHVFANGLEDARLSGDLLFADLMQNVASLRCSHSWDNALEKFPSAAFFGLSASQIKASDKSIIEGILSQAYNLSVKKLVQCTEDEDQSGKETDSFDEVKEQLESSSLLKIMKQNVVPFICALEGKTVYFLVEPYFQHSLQDMVTFSPSVLSGSHIRPLFVIYELLCALKWYHNHRMAHGALILEKVKVSKGLWIYLQGPEYMDFVSCDLNRYHLKENEDINYPPLPTDGVPYRLCETQSHLNSSELLASNWTCNDLPCLVQQWVNGELNNYDYLMALNYLAGRRLGDPNYHPVFPWVTDFSTPDGKYRDLTKSKFRLNKGDRQLDITYKAAWLDNQDGMSAAVPHHVSDVLSDITYHVYLARRTPKSILCDHVRTHWVPNEYPSSMERLYHWTPDECIPQFFSDPTIFESIHSDLPDLEVPHWTASPEEFVEWHREVLESENVSCNLHYWIDLTFGYKLGGKEAAKAKNVYLHLIDKHQSLSNHGVLQLFTQPHPEKLQRLPHASNSFLSGGVQQPLDGKLRARTVLFDVNSNSKSLEESVTSVGSAGDGDMLLRDPATLSRKTLNESGQDGGSKQATIPSVKEGSSEEDGRKGAQFEPIELPSNYNPLNLLQRFEALENFKNQFGPRIKSMADSHKSQLERETQFERLVQIDMASLGCVIVEMLLPEKVRLATAGLTGKEREKSIVRLCAANQKVLPRYAQAGVWALLRELTLSMGEDRTSRDDEQINGWIPPLTADLLLQPHLGVFPFPAYFSMLYEFLAAFYHSSRTLLSDSGDGTRHMDWEWFCFGSEDGAEYSLEQVDTAASFLPDLLAKVDDEGIKLLVCHLEPLFTCPKTRLLACTQLFDMLSQALGPRNTGKTFLKCLLSLFDSHSLENYESITRQHFLSQIIVRFGLEGFLKHFISFVVDAVAFKSMMDTKAQDGRRFSSFQTIEAVVAGFVAPDSSFPRKEPVSLDADVDLPDNFLRGSPDDQEGELEYSVSLDDVDVEFASDGLLGKINVQDVDKVGSGEEEHKFDEQVTLLPRNDDDEEGDKMIFLQGIVSDDDDIPKASARRPIHSFALKTNNGSDSDDDGDLVKGDTSDDSHGIAPGNGESKKSDHTPVNDEGRKVGTLDGGNIDDDDRSDNEDKQQDSAADAIGPGLEPIGKGTAVFNHMEKELDFEAGDKEEDVEDPCKSEVEQVDGAAPSIRKHVEGLELGKEEYTQSETLYSYETGEGEGTLTKTLKSVGRDSQDDSRRIGRQREGRVGFSLEDLTIEGDEAQSSKSSESREEEIFELGKEVDDDNVDGEEDADDDDDDKSGDQLGDLSTQPPVAYKVQTFYNDSKSKATRQEENGERDHSELTPGTISGIAAESIVWLAPRLGPVLTSKYIASQLLTMLPHCYIGHVGKADENEECVVNDRDAKWLLFCLGNFCTLYGEAFMLYQYLPYIKKTIKSVQNKITPRSEAALAGVLSLLKYCIPYLSRDTLCDYCESELMRGVFQPVIRILSSYTTVFPGGVTSRQAICRSYIDVLTVVCLKLERELARENMTAPLQQFFSCFELDRMRRISDGVEVDDLFKTIATDVENGVETTDASVRKDENDGTGVDNDNSQKQEFEALYSSPVYDELCQTFSAAIAHHAFVPLCGIMGSKYMESSLYNHDLIWNLCCSHDDQLSHPTCEDTRASEDDADGLPQEEGDGNIDQTFDEDRAAEEVDTAPKLHHEDKVGDEKIHGMSGLKKGIEKLKGKRKPPMWFIGRGFAKNRDGPSKLTSSSSSDQYLRGSWLEHWENQLNNKERIGSSFVLQQVKLQTFTGHSGTVRSLYVQDSEHCFLSASKDKTVKLWSLSNHGDGTAQSASSWTYYRHSRPVFHVGMVEAVRQAVSCDGSLHLWDPVSGRCLGIFEPTRNNPVVAMTTLPAPSQCVVAAMAEGTARFLDVRQHSFVQEWKVTTSTLAGTVRDICSSPDGRWIALGFSSGLASVLDIRGGLLRSQRRAHTSDIFQVKAFSNNSFVTSSVDQGLSLWKDDGLRMKNLRGHMDPLPSLLVWRNQVISASVSGKVGVHNLQDDQSEASYISYKLTGDVFRGGITCLGYLPLNKLLLIGSDTGNISLCC